MGDLAQAALVAKRTESGICPFPPLLLVMEHPPRRKKTAKETREQFLRADARTVQRLLKGFDSIANHRGNRLTTLGTALRNALSNAPPSQPKSTASSSPCRHFQAGRCTWGATCRFSHAVPPSAHVAAEAPQVVQPYQDPTAASARGLNPDATAFVLGPPSNYAMPQSASWSATVEAEGMPNKSQVTMPTTALSTWVEAEGMPNKSQVVDLLVTPEPHSDCTVVQPGKPRATQSLPPLQRSRCKQQDPRVPRAASDQGRRATNLEIKNRVGTPPASQPGSASGKSLPLVSSASQNALEIPLSSNSASSSAFAATTEKLEHMMEIDVFAPLDSGDPSHTFIVAPTTPLAGLMDEYCTAFGWPIDSLEFRVGDDLSQLLVPNDTPLSSGLQHGVMVYALAEPLVNAEVYLAKHELSRFLRHQCALVLPKDQQRSDILQLKIDRVRAKLLVLGG